MKGYKGFEKGMVCRGKQYAENTVFEEENAKICESGIHFCENPMDVLDFYPILDDNCDFNEFAEVEALDKAHTYDNKKYCTKKIKIGAKLSISNFIKACVEFVIDKTSSEVNEKSSSDFAQIGSSGYRANIGSSGDCANIGSSGDSTKIGSSGNSAKIFSSGNFAKIGSSGYYAQIGSSGDCAKICSSGNFAKICSSGNFAQIGSSGDCAKICSSGEDSVICCAGNNSIVKAKKGSWITLAEWKLDEERQRCIPVCVKTEFVDGERIKENTWYKLENGEFVENSNGE